VTAPLLRAGRRAAALARSLARVETEAEKRNDLGFRGAAPRAGFIRARIALRRPSQMNSSQRLGPKAAQTGVEFRGPGLCCVLRYRAGWSGPCFRSSGRKQPMRAMRMPAQAFAAVFVFTRGLERAGLPLLGRNHLRIKNFLSFLFFFFWENRIFIELPKN
jgi:hypothetical protein